MDATIQTLVIAALPVIFAIALHEAAHGYAARHFGDPTAWQLGRVSANPLRHIDMVGTILVPTLTILFGGFFFGWAKPVPIDARRLRNPKGDMLWVALAGPAANLAMALGWGGLAKITEMMPANAYAFPMSKMADIGIELNLILAVFNMLPLPPLDGGRVAVSLLPPRAASQLAQIEPWGILILLLMIAADSRGLHFLGYVLGPVIGLLRYGIALLFQLHY